MNNADLKGVAYFCCHDDCEGFTGLLVCEDRQQYGLKGKQHDHSKHNCSNGANKNEEFEDQHTCCFGGTDEAIDLYIEPLVDGIREKIVVHNVMKCGGDNFSLVSQSVNFETNELLVNEKAEDCISKFFPCELLDKGCFVTIGYFELKRKKEDSINNTSSK